MSRTGCPDWKRLAAEREAEPLVDPAGWQAAREHLAGCADCRASAAAVDPLFVFAALPPSASWSAPAGRDLDMESAVFALVRASRVALGASPSDAVPAARYARPVKVAAGLLLASFLGLAGSSSSPRPELDSAVAAAANDAAATIANLAILDEAAAAALAVDGSQPAVEEIDRPEARVYDLSHADLAVVMIVDSSLDV